MPPYLLQKIRFLAARHVSWRATPPPTWLPEPCWVWWVGDEVLCVPVEWAGELGRAGDDPHLLAGLLVLAPPHVVARGWRVELCTLLLIADHVHFHRDHGVYWDGMPPAADHDALFDDMI